MTPLEAARSNLRSKISNLVFSRGASNGVIIVGLGNPGKQYEQTRHNIGFRILDALVLALELGPWKRLGDMLWVSSGSKTLLKPVGFMNTSGAVLQSFITAKRLKVTGDQLLVVHDEIDFPLGTVRLDRNRSSAGHQGVQSIIDTLGTKDFRRLRFGIGDNRAQQVPAEKYVLEPFSPAESPVVDEAITQAVEILRHVLDDGHDRE